MTEETTEKPKEAVTFSSLGDALAFVDGLKADAQQSGSKWAQAVLELTGHQVGEPITPVDVVKIVAKVFGVAAAPEVKP